jgi:hypothetical protein
MLDHLQKPGEPPQLFSRRNGRSTVRGLAPGLEADLEGGIALGNGAGQRLVCGGLEMRDHVLDQVCQASERTGLRVARVCRGRREQCMVSMYAHDHNRLHPACPAYSRAIAVDRGGLPPSSRVGSRQDPGSKAADMCTHMFRPAALQTGRTRPAVRLAKPP